PTSTPSGTASALPLAEGMGAMTTPRRLRSASTSEPLREDATPYAVQPSWPAPTSIHVGPAQAVCPRVAAGAEWLHLDARPLVVLATRLPLRRLLLALARMKVSSPSTVPPVTAAFEAGWPGERATATAAAMRVYTAVHSLRRLGIRGVLVRR